MKPLTTLSLPATPESLRLAEQGHARRCGPATRDRCGTAYLLAVPGSGNMRPTRGG
jgi:hypothetical protein